jgi:hypothetical protein
MALPESYVVVREERRSAYGERASWRFEVIEFARKLGIGGGILAIWDSGFGGFVIP